MTGDPSKEPRSVEEMFDWLPEDEPAAPPVGEKLQKVLARSGLASRRVCEDMIDAGRVTVNGVVAELGQRVDAEHDEVADRKSVV